MIICIYIYNSHNWIRGRCTGKPQVSRYKNHGYPSFPADVPIFLAPSLHNHDGTHGRRARPRALRRCYWSSWAIPRSIVHVLFKGLNKNPYSWENVWTCEKSIEIQCFWPVELKHTTISNNPAEILGRRPWEGMNFVDPSNQEIAYSKLDTCRWWCR